MNYINMYEYTIVTSICLNIIHMKYNFINVYYNVTEMKSKHRKNQIKRQFKMELKY